MRKKGRSDSATGPAEPGVKGIAQGPVPSDLGPESSGFAGHSRGCAALGWRQCTQLLPVALQREAAQGMMVEQVCRRRQGWNDLRE